MKVRFLHTSDWQLGMTRHFLSEGAQERYNQSRFDAIRTMGRVAREENCLFVVVCGDIFESNQVDRKTVGRALEAIKEVPVPVFILPGNHDPLNAASVYRSDAFLNRKPDHVTVLESFDPVKLEGEVELVGAPWFSKRPATNPVANLLRKLQPTEKEILRICVAHGGIDYFTPNKEGPGVIALDTLEKAISEKKIHFVAMGDRHSLTKIGSGDRIWYSGTPEATDFPEDKSGHAQVVEIGEGGVSTKPVQVGQWRFLERSQVDLNSVEDLEALRKSLDEIEDKEWTILRLKLIGTLTLSLKDLLHKYLSELSILFGSFEIREEELHVVADNSDFADLGFTGFAESTMESLRVRMKDDGEEECLARDALMLMLRLARESR